MRCKRYSHSLCVLGEYIYVVSGHVEQIESVEWLEDLEDLTDSCERYNILTNRWESLPTAQLKPRYNMHLISLQHRYLIGFGDGTEDLFDQVSQKSAHEVIKLDTFHLE